MLLRFYYAFVLKILEHCSPYGGLLRNVIYSYSSARCIRWPGFEPDQTFLSLCHRRYVAALCMLYKVNSKSNHCLFSELPSVSVKIRHTRAAAAARPIVFEVSRCRTSQFARCFLPAQTRVWNDLLYTVFHTGTLEGLQGAVNRASLSLFFNFLWRRCLWGFESNL